MDKQKIFEFDSLIDYDGRCQKQRICFKKFIDVTLQAPPVNL